MFSPTNTWCNRSGLEEAKNLTFKMTTYFCINSLFILSIVNCTSIPSPILPLPTPPTTGNHEFVLSICESVSALLYVFISFYFYFLIASLSDNILVILYLTYFTKHNTLSVHMLLQMAKFQSFLWRNNIPLCMYININTHIISSFEVHNSGALSTFTSLC